MKKIQIQKGDVVAVNSNYKFIAVVKSVEGNQVNFYSHKIYPSAVRIDFVKLATLAQIKLLGNRKFAEVEFIEDKPKVVKEKAFPKDNWVLKITKANLEVVSDFMKKKGSEVVVKHWNWVDYKGNGYLDYRNYNKNLDVITTDQFLKHVLNQNKPTATKETKWIPKVGDWAKRIKDGSGMMKVGMVKQITKVLSIGIQFENDILNTYDPINFVQAQPHEIPKQTSETETLKAEIEKLKSELEREKSRTQTFVEKSEKWVTIANEKTDEVNGLENELKVYKTENNKFGNENVELIKKVNSYSNTIDLMSKTIYSHEAKIDTLHKEIEIITKYNIEVLKQIIKE